MAPSRTVVVAQEKEMMEADEVLSLEEVAVPEGGERKDIHRN